MIKDTTVENDVINKIINIIDIEKGLSKNSKNAYASDIILMNDWFSKQNINFLNAKEIDFKNLFSFFKSQNLKQNSINRKLSSMRQFYQTLQEEEYIQKNPLNNINIFPNPTNGLVNINLGNHNGPINYTISTVEGRVVNQENNVVVNKLNNLSKSAQLLLSKALTKTLNYPQF